MSDDNISASHGDNIWGDATLELWVVVRITGDLLDLLESTSAKCHQSEYQIVGIPLVEVSEGVLDGDFGFSGHLSSAH